MSSSITYTKNESNDTASLQNISKLIQSKRRLPFVNDKLSWVESSKCLKFLTDIDPDKVPASWRELFMSFLVCSDISFEFEVIITDEKVHSILYNILPQCDFTTLITVFRTMFSQFLKEPTRYREEYLQFLEFLNTKHLLLNISMYYLETIAIDDPKLTECLNFLDLYLTTILLLTNFKPDRLSILVAELYFEMIRCQFTVVITQLLLQSDNSDIRHKIIQKIINKKIEISNFLAETKLEDCKYVEERLAQVIEESMDGDQDLKRKLDSIQNLTINSSELNLLQVLDVIVFLKEPDLTFKRIFIEHLLFGGNPFPFYKAVSRISDELHQFFIQHQSELKEKPYLISFIMNKESFLESIMKVQLKVWIESGSKSADDMESVFMLIPVLLEKLDTVLQDVYGAVPLDELPEIVNNFIKSIDYRKARDFQLDRMRRTQLEKWKQQMVEFDSILINQVHDFVKNQRLIRFQKGVWVYSQNPTDASLKQPKLYFTIVSDNQANLLVREFETKTETQPCVEGMKIVSKTASHIQPLQQSVTLVIPLKSIAYFESRDVSVRSQTGNSSTKLVNLGQLVGYTKVKLLDKNKKRLLKVYLDTKEKKSIWLDGLQLLSPYDIKENLSADTKQQQNDLISLRKDVQMVNLHTKIALDATVGLGEDDDEFYDLDTLLDLPLNNYYE
ncbi:similar to Saccharomyces cerevisiae YLL007C Putative protein of unknown function [Maudiozyma saulgeensis]|uniref:PH domain-containing protein n=1 Tax=Maudiozyma saulgeensis TaxID=1789683 RepID=A0A1X7QYW5_9SACH|nr:similar to Saccharomyces cerevisiae YLL007C Putative protein of unknown function [Kazachstania saulgeensis]